MITTVIDLLIAVSFALVGALYLSFLVNPADLPDVQQFFVNFVGP
jgi:ABC-type phosphate transport system permease subunit